VIWCLLTLVGIFLFTPFVRPNQKDRTWCAHRYHRVFPNQTITRSENLHLASHMKYWLSKMYRRIKISWSGILIKDYQQV
jgi:hypothetical protein